MSDYTHHTGMDVEHLYLNGTEITPSATELNQLKDAGAVKADFEKLHATTATAAELNHLDLSAVGALAKIKKISITTPADASEHSSGFTLPAKAIVLDVFVDVTTAEATGGTKTLDVGTDSTDSGDADGFLDGISVAATGLVRGKATITAGSTETYFASTTKGALLASLTAGSDVAQDTGTYYEFPDTTMGGKEITYTAGSADFAELTADIYVVYIEIG